MTTGAGVVSVVPDKCDYEIFITFVEYRMRLSITQASLVLHSAFTIFIQMYNV